LLALLISEPLGGGRGALLLELPPLLLLLLLLLLSCWKLLRSDWTLLAGTLLKCVLKVAPSLRTLPGRLTKA
jgi:hypothetical protein